MEFFLSAPIWFQLIAFIRNITPRNHFDVSFKHGQKVDQHLIIHRPGKPETAVGQIT